MKNKKVDRLDHYISKAIVHQRTATRILTDQWQFVNWTEEEIKTERASSGKISMRYAYDQILYEQTALAFEFLFKALILIGRKTYTDKLTEDEKTHKISALYNKLTDNHQTLVEDEIKNNGYKDKKIVFDCLDEMLKADTRYFEYLGTNNYPKEPEMDGEPLTDKDIEELLSLHTGIWNYAENEVRNIKYPN